MYTESQSDASGDLSQLEEEEQKKPATQETMKSIISEFIRLSIKGNHMALPIFNRITPDGTFPLVNYQINDSLINSLEKTLPQMIPQHISKIYLINNAIPESSIKQLILSLNSSRHLEAFGII